MKNYFILFAMLFVLSLSACSIPKEPRLAFGKKCVEKNSDIVYSYVWLYNKGNGLEANKQTCKLIED
jgi:hypothetical protein|tara:strand:- start:1186 stop:1386 length:201 start_codon:yes stop_codon:yes gene_type:complete